MNASWRRPRRLLGRESQWLGCPSTPSHRFSVENASSASEQRNLRSRILKTAFCSRLIHKWTKCVTDTTKMCILTFNCLWLAHNELLLDKSFRVYWLISLLLFIVLAHVLACACEELLSVSLEVGLVSLGLDSKEWLVENKIYLITSWNLLE